MALETRRESTRAPPFQNKATQNFSQVERRGRLRVAVEYITDKSKPQVLRDPHWMKKRKRDSFLSEGHIAHPL
jgi:hypothetical protein